MHVKRWGACALVLVCLGACSGSSGSGTPVGVDNAVQGYVVERMGRVFAAVSRMRLLIPVLLIPGMRTAAGITFELDTNVGVPPNTYDFSIPLDSNGNGSLDATISGRATLSADPSSGGALVAGFQSSIELTVTTDGGQGVFVGTIAQSFDAGGSFLVSGGGDYTDAATGSTVTLAVDALAPLHVKTASDEGDERPNACTWSVDGQVDVEASNADGDYAARWTFVPTSRLVQVTEASFTPPGAMLEELPDSRFEAGPCLATGGLNDWAGLYVFDFFCVPSDTGQSELTVTVLDANTIEVVDDDLVYRAHRDAHNPHVVHGSFEDTDGGGLYEEDFTWVLAADGQSFQQVSEYFYLSGPAAGSSGICGGVGVRN